MAYNKTVWKDRNIQRPNTFKLENNVDGTVTLIPKPGTVTEPGTPVSAENLNKIEDGILAVESQLLDNTIKTLQIDSPSIPLADSIDGIMQVESIKGITLQNLAEILSKSTEITVIGSKYTFPANINGLSISFKKNKLVAGKEYTIVFTAYTNGGDRRVSTDFYPDTYPEIGTVLVDTIPQLCRYKFTPSTDFINNGNSVRIYIGTATDKDLIIQDCMIMEGDWTNRLIPGYFTGISSVGETWNKIIISSVGKNLINITKALENLKSATGVADTSDSIIVENNSLQFSHGSIALSLIPGAKYILQRKFSVLSGANNYAGSVGVLHGHTERWIDGIGSTANSVSFRAPSSGCVIIRFFLDNGAGTNVKVKYHDVQLELDTLTGYEVNKNDSLEVKLKEPLRGLKSNSDEIIQGKLIKRVGKATLNGSENWIASSSNTTDKLNYAAFVRLDNHKSVSSLLSDKFTPVTVAYFENVFFNNTSKLMAITYANGAVSFMIPKDMLNTPDLAGFKAWLQANPTTVYYDLAVQVEENLNINSLKSFKSGSLQLSNAIPPSVTVKYPLNTASRLSNVEDILIDVQGNSAKLANEDLPILKTQLDLKTSKTYVDNELTKKISRTDITELLNTLKGYNLAINDIGMLLNAIIKKSCNIAYWGDSITQGGDAIDVSMMYYYVFSTAFRRSFPDAVFPDYNFGLGGRIIENAANSVYTSPTNFTAPWATTSGKAWREYVRDSNPDLLFISFGMNAQTSVIAGVNALASIKAYIDSWTKKPTVILMTNFLPNREWIGESGYKDRIQAMRYTREWCAEVGYNLLDIGELYSKLVLGKSEINMIAEKYLDFTMYETQYVNISGKSAALNGTALWSKLSPLNFKLSFNVLFTADSILGIRFRNGYSIFLYSNGNHIMYFNSEIAYPMTAIPNFALGEHTIEFKVIGARIVLVVDGAEIINRLRYYDFLEGSYRITSEAGTVTVKNLATTIYNPEITNRVFTSDDIVGVYTPGNTNLKYPNGGNGVNHPSAQGISTLYVPIINEFIRIINPSVHSLKAYKLIYP